MSYKTGYLALFILGLILPAVGSAEQLQDPTRPPAGVLAPVAASVVVRTVGLQSIYISPGRRAAIVNGSTVELGGMTTLGRLIEVNTAYVVLKTSKGRRVLKLFPDVKITRTEAIKVEPAVDSVEKK